MAVLTSDDMGMMRPTIEVEEKKETQQIEVNLFKHKYILPNAVKGESSCTFYADGKEISIKLMDGIYGIPENTPDIEKHNLGRKLMAAGFKQYCENKVIEVEKNEIPKITKWKLGHPDNEPDNKKNCDYSIRVGKHEHKLHIQDGFVTVEDEAVAKALMKQGFYEISSGGTVIDNRINTEDKGDEKTDDENIE